jgi:hypothetical protein
MRKARGGFTIVETLIFLAVSGAMFVIAFYGMRGQQDSVGFRQSLNGMEQKIREIYNNVDNGYFGSIGQYACTATAPNYHVVIAASVPNATTSGGDSGDCIFIGKTVDFINDNHTQMNIETLIGSRLDPDELVYGDSILEVDELFETFAIGNGVEWRSSYLYDAEKNQYTSVNNLRVSAQRDRNSEDNVQADLRAQRRYNVDNSETWLAVDNQNVPMFCFALGDRKGSVKIAQKDISVDYNGVGCQ